MIHTLTTIKADLWKRKRTEICVLDCVELGMSLSFPEYKKIHDSLFKSTSCKSTTSDEEGVSLFTRKQSNFLSKYMWRMRTGGKYSDMFFNYDVEVVLGSVISWEILVSLTRTLQLSLFCRLKRVHDCNRKSNMSSRFCRGRGRIIER